MLAKNQWVTMALTLVALILGLRLAFRQRPTSTGLRAKIAQNTCDCLGSRLIVFRLLHDGTTFINFEPIGNEAVPELISRIYERTRLSSSWLRITSSSDELHRPSTSFKAPVTEQPITR